MTRRAEYMMRGAESVRAPINLGDGRAAFYGDAPYRDDDYELSLWPAVMNGDRNEDMESIDDVYDPDRVLMACPAVVPNGRSGYLNYDRVGLDVDRDDPAERLRMHKQELEYDAMWGNGPDMHGSQGANYQVEMSAQENARDLSRYSTKDAGGHGGGDNSRTTGFCRGMQMTDRMPARRRAQDRMWREEPVRKNQLFNMHAPNASRSLPRAGVTQRGIEQEFRGNWRNSIMEQPVDTALYPPMQQKAWTSEQVGGYVGTSTEDDRRARGVAVKETQAYVGAPASMTREQSYEQYANRFNKKLADEEREWVGAPGGQTQSQGPYVQQQLEMRRPWKVVQEDRVTALNAQRQQGSRYAVDAQLVDEFRDDAKIPYKLVDQPKIVDELNDPRGGWSGIYVKNQPRDSLKHQPEVRERVRAGGIGLDNSKGLDEQRKSVLKATKRNQKERVVGAGGFNNMAGGIYEVASPRRSHTFIEKQPESDLLRAYLENPYTQPITNL